MLESGQGAYHGHVKRDGRSPARKTRRSSMNAALGRLMDALPGLVWTAGPDGSDVFLNERWRGYAGVSRGDPDAVDWPSIIHPDDLPAAVAQWRDALHSQSAADMQARLRRSDGAYRWFHIKMAPILDASGDLQGWCGINFDIDDRLKADRAARDLQRRLDETLRKESENELRQAHRQLAEAQRLSQTGSFTANIADGVYTWSDEFYRICEIDRSEPITFDDLRQLVHPEDIDSFALDKLSREVEFPSPDDAATDRPSRNEADFHFRIVTPTNSVKYLRGVASVTTDGTGKPVLIGAIQDVTESKLAEAALRESEAELRRTNRFLANAQRLSETGTYTWDPERDDQTWSEETYRIWEFDPAEELSMGKLIARIFPEDLPHVETTIAAALPTGADYQIEYRIRTDSGKVKHLQTVSQRSPDVTDRLVYFGTSRDITKSKLVEEALKKSEAELRQANNFLTEAQRLSRTGSFTWDMVRDEHNWSEEIYRIWGFEPGTLITTEGILGGIHPEDRPLCAASLQRAIEGEELDIYFRIVTPGGQIKHVHTVGHRTDQVADPVFIGATQDITESKRAEEALERARAQLERVARVTALSALTASIAHEVNQPLSGIITNASTCLRMLAMDPPNIDGSKMTAQRMIRDANRASDVIQRLRALFARSEPSLGPVDLNEAVREVIAIAANDLQTRRITIRTEFSENTPRVMGDRVQLQQVVLNLMLNATDAMASVEDRPRELSVITRENGRLAHLIVRDNGPGFDPDAGERLFNDFYTTKPKGMGIGLSISRAIIEAHEGTIGACLNEDGPGATFAVSIPCLVARDLKANPKAGSVEDGRQFDPLDRERELRDGVA